MNGKSYNNPWNVNYLENDLNAELLEHFKGEKQGFVQIGQKKYYLPQKFAREGENYYYFKPRSTDTWVVSFPRSGTTWTQEMVWLLGTNLNFKGSADEPLVTRFPFLEFSTCVNDDVFEEFKTNIINEDLKEELEKACGSVIEELDNMKKPRFIKSHLPFSLLPPDLLTCGAKVIYVARHPKDVAVSYYNFHQFIRTLDYVGDFKTFWNYFEQNLVLWAPYWDHIIEAWNMRNNPNLLFLFYEDLKNDLRGSLEKIAKFLEKCYNNENFEQLEDHLCFKNFQNNQSVNMEVLRPYGMLAENNQKCVRQGKNGGWKEYFTPELNEQADRWMKKNLERTDLRFPNI